MNQIKLKRIASQIIKEVSDILNNVYDYIKTKPKYKSKYDKLLKKKKLNQRLSIYLEEQHEVKKNTPTMGGLIFIIPTILAIIIIILTKLSSCKIPFESRITSAIASIKLKPSNNGSFCKFINSPLYN